MEIRSHSLATPDALAQGWQHAHALFPKGRPEHSIRTPHCVIHVVPNQWDEHAYHWTGAQREHFSADQLAYLADNLSTLPDRQHLLLTHSPVFGLPTKQTGFLVEHNDYAYAQPGRIHEFRR